MNVSDAELVREALDVAFTWIYVALLFIISKFACTAIIYFKDVKVAKLMGKQENIQEEKPLFKKWIDKIKKRFNKGTTYGDNNYSWKKKIGEMRREGEQ